VKSKPGTWLFVVTKDELIEGLKKHKKLICQYGQDFGERCDCKYGGSGKGEDSGCPEITMVIAGLQQMKPKEYEKFLKGWGIKI
jgi:hypothetical protein